MRLRRKSHADTVDETDKGKDEVATDVVDRVPEPAAVDVRANGPWDVSEKSPGEDPAYIDLGALIIKGEVGFNLQLPTDGDSDIIGSAVLMTEDSAIELRAFAASRSGGLWEQIRADLIEEVEKLGGEYEATDGAFGPEIRIRVPVPDQPDVFQPSRILGIEGPRWFLRATLLGKAGLEPDDEGVLIEALRNTIVVRGSEPMMPRDALTLTVPAGAEIILAEDEGSVSE